MVFWLVASGALAGKPSNGAVDSVLIEGHIGPGTAAKFAREVFRPGIKRVLLDPPGGSVESALEMAHLIHVRSLDVEVIGECFSCCANYLFVAGRVKKIGPKGMVAWHGNLHHLSYMLKTGKLSKDGIPPEFLADLSRVMALEDRFFQSLGVDQFVCWFGKIEPFNVFNLYFLGVEDMARFGIRGVVARPGYETTDVSQYDRHGVGTLRLLKVDWSQFKAEAPDVL